MEEWRTIKGYSNYLISSTGKVKNVKTNHTITHTQLNNGYYIVKMVDDNGVRKNRLVHRLLAEAFIPNPEHKEEVNHINYDRGDNRLENLEWVSHTENMCKASHNVYIEQYTPEGELVAVYRTVRLAAEAVGGARSGLYNYLIYNTRPLYRGFIFRRKI